MTDLVHISSKGTQDYTTPPELVQYFARSNGVELILDLASSDENHRCPYYLTEAMDLGLAPSRADWARELLTNAAIINMPPHLAAAWLNPPFKRCGAFMERAKLAADQGAKIITLTLASLGTDWYRKWVKPYALSLILEERVRFLGQPDDYPKELMVSFYGFGRTGLGWTRWKKEAYATYDPPMDVKTVAEFAAELAVTLPVMRGDIPSYAPIVDIAEGALHTEEDPDRAARVDDIIRGQAEIEGVDAINFAIGKGSWDGAFDNMPDGLED